MGNTPEYKAIMEETLTDNPTPADQVTPDGTTGETIPASVQGSGNPASDASTSGESVADSTASPAAPPAQKPAPKEARRAQRYRVKWRCAVLTGSAANQTTHYGWLKDISISGTAIFTEKSIPPNPSVVLYIEVPSAIGEKEPHVLMLQARIVYGVYDSPSNQFRAGIEFIKFSSGKDQTFLTGYLEQHCHPLSH